MPWKETTKVSQRTEFISLVQEDEVNISKLCQQFGISRKTGYKWLRRYREGGLEALADRSRRPHHSPHRSSQAIEETVLSVREAHPAWGGRKIKAYLENQVHGEWPTPSTITAILDRHGLIDPKESSKHHPFQRFEMEQPNQLWQMDFKGYFVMEDGARCHPLTVLDDHSRFLLGLRACPNQKRQTVQAHLSDVFRNYGLPERMLMDNGSPWGDDADTPHTILTAWLLRLGVQVSHGRPYHPQTQGKDERLHRTLQVELISKKVLHDLDDCQQYFDQWREIYNYERPHEALNLHPPATCYRKSPRPFPEVLPPILYNPGDIVRNVDECGVIYFKNRRFRVGKAFRLQPVAIRFGECDGIYDVYFCQKKIDKINLRDDHND